MQTFNLGELAARKTRRRRVALPPITDSRGAQKEYRKTLRAILRALAKAVREDILPAAERELAAQKAALTRDAWGEFQFQQLLDLSVTLRIAAEGLVGRILMLEGKRHTEKWQASVRSTLGIDIAAVVREEDIAELVQAALRRNAALIRSLADDVVARVERATYDAILQGKTAKQLRDDLTHQFGVADSRAKLIARDQTAKLTSDLNRIRHQQAGIDRYVWSTSKDERVRPRHQKLDGREYAYSEPTGAEDGLPPGKPIQCRCVARAVVSFD
jgi:SPP1 gp7 family putative phage head morphogenesis protein